MHTVCKTLKIDQCYAKITESGIKQEIRRTFEVESWFFFFFLRTSCKTLKMDHQVLPNAEPLKNESWLILWKLQKSSHAHSYGTQNPQNGLRSVTQRRTFKICQSLRRTFEVESWIIFRILNVTFINVPKLTKFSTNKLVKSSILKKKKSSTFTFIVIDALFL